MKPSLLLLAGAVVAAKVVHDATTQRRPEDYKPLEGPGVNNGPTPEWPHLVFGQMDALGKHQGWAPGRSPFASGGHTPVPITYVSDARRIAAYWLERVRRYKAEQYYTEEGALSFLPGGANFLDFDWWEQLTPNTRNPYRTWIRRNWSAQRLLAQRIGESDPSWRHGGWDVTDPFKLVTRTATTGLGGLPDTVEVPVGIEQLQPYVDQAEKGWSILEHQAEYPSERLLSVNETDAFWFGLIDVAQALRVTEQFNPSEWATAMDALGEAAAEAPATLTRWLGEGTTKIVQLAADVAARGIGGALQGLLPLAPLVLVGWLVWRAL